MTLKPSMSGRRLLARALGVLAVLAIVGCGLGAWTRAVL